MRPRHHALFVGRERFLSFFARREGEPLPCGVKLAGEHREFFGCFVATEATERTGK
jgi:hypothetical protein